MKNKIAVALLCLLGFIGVSRAEIMQSSKEEPVLVRFTSSTIVGTTSFILIDLPSIYNATSSSYSHLNNGAINIISLNVDIAKIAASSVTVKIGVLTEVNASTGSVKYFWGKNLSKDATATHLDISPDFNHFLARCKVIYTGLTNGITPFITSNDVAVNQTHYKQTNALFGTNTTAAYPHVGDIVIDVTNIGTLPTAANAIDLSVTALYNSEYK